jgi:hypothetical protein
MSTFTHTASGGGSQLLRRFKRPVTDRSLHRARGGPFLWFERYTKGERLGCFRVVKLRPGKGMRSRGRKPAEYPPECTPDPRAAAAIVRSVSIVHPTRMVLASIAFHILLAKEAELNSGAKQWQELRIVSLTDVFYGELAL